MIAWGRPGLVVERLERCAEAALLGLEIVKQNFSVRAQAGGYSLRCLSRKPRTLPLAVRDCGLWTVDSFIGQVLV